MKKIMEHRLFICNNPYQIIVSIMLTVQLDDRNVINDILITDNFNGGNKVFENLKKNSHFNNLYKAKINDILFPNNFPNKIKKFYYLFNEKKFLEGRVGKKFANSDYDEIYYNNDDMFLYHIVANFYKKNKMLKVYRFEEGYSSYIRPFCSLRAQDFFNRKIRDKNFKELLAGMYYFRPEQVQFEAPAKLYNIKRTINDIVKETIRAAFPVENVNIDLENKLIIFEESFYKDHGYTSDEVLYKEIIDKVGSENIILKLHPRSTVNRFKKMNVRLLECGDAPWEAVLLLNDFKNVKLMSLASGSIINSRLMLGDETKSFLMYRCVDKPVPTLNDSFDRFICEFVKDNNKGLYIPNKLEDVYSYL